MKKCLFIAPLETHATIGRVAALACTGFELHVIDVSTARPKFDLSAYPFNQMASYVWLNMSLGRGSYRDKLVESLRSLKIFPQPRKLKQYLAREIIRIDPSVVVSYYGPIGIYFAGLVKDINKKLPVVSILNLIPSSLDAPNTFIGFVKTKLSAEINNYKSILKKLEFIVCASSSMKSRILSQYKLNKYRISVIPDFFPEKMNFKLVPKDSRLKSSGVIFLGSPERWGATIDDLDDQFLDLAKSGVLIHAAKMSNRVISSGNAFCYKYFQDDEVFAGCLSTYAHRFQASIITYGIVKRHQRFETTLPTRFFSALSAGLPIAVRAGLFDAVEKYVERYEIGFKYYSAAQLKERLSDNSKMSLYRKNTIKHSKKYFAEAQGVKFAEIFKNLNLITIRR